MNLKTFLQSPWFQRIVLVVWLVSSALVMFSQRTIDGIVNKTLYSYGLQFNSKWYSPYWTYAHLLYGAQFVAIGFTVVALASSFLKKSTDDKQAPKIEKTEKNNIQKEETICCPSCKKVFSKPLVTLDFSGEKPKLITICPYCDTVLSKPTEQKDFETIINQENEIIQKE